MLLDHKQGIHSVFASDFPNLLHPVCWWWTQPHCWTSRNDHCCRTASRACMGPPRDIQQHSHWMCRKNQRDKQKHLIQMLSETKWNRTANGSVLTMDWTLPKQVWCQPTSLNMLQCKLKKDNTLPFKSLSLVIFLMWKEGTERIFEWYCILPYLLSINFIIPYSCYPKQYE